MVLEARVRLDDFRKSDLIVISLGDRVPHVKDFKLVGEAYSRSHKG